MFRLTALLVFSTTLFLALFQVFDDPAFANGYDTYPPPLVWSPDGNLLAAAVDGGLSLIHADGRSEAITRMEAFSPSFSRDGRYLAYVQDGELWTYDFISRTSVPLLDRGDVLDCAFGRGDAGAILYFSAGERFYGCDIFSLELATGELSQVTDTGEDSALAPVPSAMGENLVYVVQIFHSPGGYEQLWRLDETVPDGDPATGSNEQSKMGGYHESNPAWLDSHTVIFQRGGWGDWNLYRLDLSTGRERIEVPDAQQPSLTRDGRLLLFTRRSYLDKILAEYDWEIAPSVWLRDRESGVEYQVSASGAWAEHPAISPDGSHLAWVESRDGSAAVVIRTVVEVVEEG